MKGVDYIILKLTTFCNLACRYCSAHTQEAVPAMLDEKLAVNFVEDVVRSAKRYSCNEIRLLLHGGEPTLYPVAAMRSIMTHAEAVASNFGIQLSYSIQSNGVGVSDAWERLIEEKNVSVGLSLDGPAEIHDAIRRTHAGDSTYTLVEDRLKRFKSHGISASVLSVIDERHVGKEDEFADWMCELDVSVKANPRFPTHGEATSFISYFDFLKCVFERLAVSPRFQEQHFGPVEDWLAAILWGERMTACSLSGKCGERMLCLSPNGQVSLCGRLLDAGIICEEYRPGHLDETRRKMLSELGRLMPKSIATLGCCQCPYANLCHGGCGAFSQNSVSMAWCGAAKKYFAYLTKDGLRILKAGLLSRRFRSQSFLSAVRDLKQVKADGN